MKTFSLQKFSSFFNPSLVAKNLIIQLDGQPKEKKDKITMLEIMRVKLYQKNVLKNVEDMATKIGNIVDVSKTLKYL